MTTLLAVDDSNTMRKVFEITFAGEDDLDVVLAAGANDALGLLNERRPTLALIDVTLVGTDGYALCEQVKRRSPEVRVMLMSSKQHPYDPGRGTAAGADDHLDKPFDTQALIERVRTLLESAPVAIVEEAPYPAPTPPGPSYEPEPQYQEPQYQEPQYQEPQYQEPQYQEPQYQEPQYQEPQQPQYQEPAYAPPRQAPEGAHQEPPMPLAAQPAYAPDLAADPAVFATATVRPGDDDGAAFSVGSNGIGALPGRLAALGLTAEQVSSVLALSREVIEQAVWEVVPTLAEALIKEEIARLTRD